jgi:hypothetical protein
MSSEFSEHLLETAFQLLNGRLTLNDAPPARLVICGGAALIATGLLSRTTRDVDIVALIDSSGRLAEPAPLPDSLLKAAKEVAQALKLPENWMNNGPSHDDGGLFQMGLPRGLQKRLHMRNFGDHLTLYFVDRIDQIHFKLYAAVDRGGYHIADLVALNPTDKELIRAARWTMTHDVSDAFRTLLKQLLERLEYEYAAENI